MRQTSLDAYNKIRESGILSKRRWQAYDELYQHGPLTGSELNRNLRNVNMHKRCSELEGMGVVYEPGERTCEVTGETVTTWDVTSVVPIRELVEMTTEHEVECPHCKSKLVHEEHTLNGSLLKALWALYLYDEPVGLSVLDLHPNQVQHFPKLKYWNLVYELGGQKGTWAVKKPGIDFIRGKARVPQKAWTRLGEVVRFDGKQVAFADYTHDIK